jgi:FkbH-like protein
MELQMGYASKEWIELYLLGDYRPRRALRFLLQDVLVGCILKLESRFGMSLAERRWLPLDTRIRLRRMVSAYRVRRARRQHNNHQFRAPTDLRVSDHPMRRIALIGSCLAHEWQFVFQSQGVVCDFVLSNFLNQMPETPPAPVGDYDFQVVQLPLRSILPDMCVARLPYNDIQAHEALLDHSKKLLAQILSEAMRWNSKYGLLTFVANFLAPQQDPSGRLMPRHDVRNPTYFVEQLNICLSDELSRYQNVYLLDIDQIAATFGKKYVQDDVVQVLGHGSAQNNYDYDHDQFRIEPTLPLTEYYHVQRDQFILAIWSELVAMYRTLNNVDAVKLVVVDLDDTLWRGVVAEEEQISSRTTEGWPLGVLEALCFLKRRGILLAIVSKNDEQKIIDIWDKITYGRIKLSDFVAYKINWRPKAQNLEEIIRDVNVLPRNVLFVDDNPSERASVKAAFPDVRVLDGHHYYWRRTLLWAPETQVSTVTKESSQRTQMVQAQIKRETSRQRLSREEFMASLAVSVRLFELRSTDNASFPRVLELVNKTNQFNTTGRRWTRDEFLAAFQQGKVIYAFEVEDRFTPYGLVGAAIVDGQCIEQFVMSCRVLGLDVEITAVAEITRRIISGEQREVRGEFVVTTANSPSRDLFQRCGFEEADGHWIKRVGESTNAPRHVMVL